MQFRRVWAAACAGVSVIAIQGAAYAQNTPDSASADAEKAFAGDIIVTANKREESLSKVGQTITAISGAMLADRKISSLDDIAAAVPGLSYAPSAGATPILTLRGIGFNEQSLGVYPAVSSYVDEVPLAFPVMTLHAAFDLERIEVLKGPQGTLFGQNATGGAINFVAAKPTNTWQAGGDISYGRFNTVEGNAFVSGPVSDNAGVRLAVTGLNSDDWQKSVTRRDTNGSKSYVAGRFLFEFEPSDSARFLLNINGFKDKSDPQAQQSIAFRPSSSSAAIQQAVIDNYTNGINFAPNNARAADWTGTTFDPALGTPAGGGAIVPGSAPLVDFSPFSDRKFVQASLRADVDLTDEITITSLTSYSDYDQLQNVSTSGTEYLQSNIVDQTGRIKSFNQELRIANDNAERLRWLVGFNYEDSKTDEDYLVRFTHTAYRAGTMFINAPAVHTYQDIRNYALFGNAEFSVNDRVVLKGGIRYTNSRNKAELCNTTIPGGNVDLFFNFLGNAVGGGTPFTPVGPDDCYSLNEQNVPIGVPVFATLEEDNISWRGGVDFQVNSDLLLYANVSRGYKAGSFPSLTASNIAAFSPVNQEVLTAYEGGVKAKFMDGRGSVNGAVFYYDYKDKQVRGKLSDIIFNQLDALINVPKSRVFGIEADVTIRPVDGLTVSAAATYLDSKITDYTAINVVGVTNFDHSGATLPFTPKLSGTFNVDYRAETSGGGTPFVGFTISARSKADSVIAAREIDYFNTTGSYAKPGVDCVFCIKGYATVDARLGYEAEDGRWKVMAWGKNILDKYYWTSVHQSYDGASRFAGMPATYGVTFGFKFD
ncbi:MAG: TonB-dependent receptor [Parasphingorhabdus sp.]|uniref:TonB-dependent receptor n=1 Tax=Parasphingorhabdus sp. TaxID=2709688 RepID=UPI00300106B1